ncbi:MAG: hypothetical protein L3J26_05790 [Candidatus Polarisedimenticolaceae bacterium]|nr:hypothetical protein [Candidatus Polarisedimenticolaceae bacterium]
MKNKLLKSMLASLLGLTISAAVQAVPIVGGLGTTAAKPALDFSAYNGDHAGILTVGGFQFAERFVGQTVVGEIGPSTSVLTDPLHDRVTGSPTGGSLQLETTGTGSSPSNIGVFSAYNAVHGYGSDGTGLYGAGALSILFPQTLSEIGFNILGALGATTNALFFQFFEADGTQIGSELAMHAVSGSYGFKINPQAYSGTGIRGMTVSNLDQGGIALQFPKQTVPAPATLLLLAGGLGLMRIFRLPGRAV